MKTPDEIAREIVRSYQRQTPFYLEAAIAAAIAAEREARETAEAERDEARRDQCSPSCNAIVDAANERTEKAEAELKEWKGRSASWKRECSEWRVLADDMSEKAAKLSTARADALREAAEHFKRLAIVRKMWSADQVAAAIEALIDKEGTDETAG